MSIFLILIITGLSALFVGYIVAAVSAVRSSFGGAIFGAVVANLGWGLAIVSAIWWLVVTIF